MAGCPVCSPRPTCEGCGNQIDPDCCGCGDSMATHASPYSSGHMLVPMGCDCFRNSCDNTEVKL